jgi:hypothetical protein
MVDGRTGPEHRPWGITLAHANRTQFVMVTAHPRDWFQESMVGPGGDVTEEVALSLTMVQVNLALSGLQRQVKDSTPGLIKALVRRGERTAHLHQHWTRAQWTVRGADLPGDQATASLTSLAGWQSGFTLDHPDLYLIIHTYGTADTPPPRPAQNPGPQPPTDHSFMIIGGKPPTQGQNSSNDLAKRSSRHN